MAQAMTNYLREALLNLLFHQGANPYVSPVYISLHTGAPGDTGALEVTGTEWTNYARQSVVTTSAGSRWTAPANTGDGEYIDNLDLISFGTASVTGSQDDLKAFGIADALTVGNFFLCDWLITGRVPCVGLATGDIIHAPAHGRSNDDLVAFVGSALPTPLVEGTEYYVISATTDNFQVSATQGGGAIVLTADGAGEVGLSRFKPVTDQDTVQIGIGDLDIVFA